MYSIQHSGHKFSAFISTFERVFASWEGNWGKWVKYRGNRSHMFYKMFVLENFANFTGMHLRCSYFFLDWQVYNTGQNIWSKQ